MKITVVKNLNARSAPSTEAECASYKIPGDILDIDKIVSGTMIDGNYLWYHCVTDGCFYWSGGTAQTAELLDPRPVASPYTPEELLDIHLSAANELVPDFSAKMENFKGLAVGYKNADGAFSSDIALVFYVSDKNDAAEPAVPTSISYRGFQVMTDVRQMGDVKLQNWPVDIEPDNGPLYLMGGSISEIIDNRQDSVGTRSLLVTKKDQGVDKIYLLTCYHVACSSLFENGQYDLNATGIQVAIPSKMVSPRFKSLPPASVAAGGFGLSYDYALVAVDASQFSNNIPNYPFAGYYTLDQIKNNFLNNKKLLKYGASTLEKTGTYRTYHSASTDLGGEITMSGVIETSCMSDKGDSGSPVIDPDNNFLVGFIIAGFTTGIELERCSFILPYAQLDFKFSIKPYIDLP